jgi:hypothetical protein
VLSGTQRACEICEPTVKAIEQLTVCSDTHRLHSIHGSAYNSSLLVRILDQINPFHNISPYFLKIHFNAIITFYALLPRSQYYFMYLVDILYAFLGALAKLRKATVSFVMSVRPSVRMEQLGFQQTDFYGFDIWVFFEKLSRKFQFLLKSDKNNGYFI